MWQEIEKTIEVPSCLKKLLNLSGYTTAISLKRFNELSIAQLEKYIEDNKLNLTISGEHSELYKQMVPFEFLPGHKELLIQISKILREQPILETNEHEHSNYTSLLKSLLDSAEQNAKSNRPKYENELMYFCVYIFLIGGKFCYETIQKNLSIPAITTIYKYISDHKKFIIEGVVRSDELKLYLDNTTGKTIHTVWLSEDATGKTFKKYIYVLIWRSVKSVKISSQIQVESSLNTDSKSI